MGSFLDAIGWMFVTVIIMAIIALLVVFTFIAPLEMSIAFSVCGLWIWFCLYLRKRTRKDM